MALELPNWQDFLDLTNYEKKKKKLRPFNEEQLKRAFFSGMWKEQEISKESQAEIKEEFKRSFFQRNYFLFIIILIILAVVFLAAFFFYGGIETIEGLLNGG